MAMLSALLAMFCVLTISHKSNAPPVPKCVVKLDVFLGVSKTECGQGPLESLSTLKSEPVPQRAGRLGADNMADLILSRGGIFNYDKRNLDNHYICPKHKDEYGADWLNQQPKTRGGSGQMVAKCNAPDLPSYFMRDGTNEVKPVTHQGATQSDESADMTKQESQLLLGQLHKFVPLGTGMCRRHKQFVKTVTDDKLGETEAAETQTDDLENAPDPLGRDEAGRCLRLQQRNPWSPRQRALIFDTPPGAASQRSTASSDYSPQQEDPSEVIKGCIRKIANVICVPDDQLRFSTSDFSQMATGTKSNRAKTALRIIEAILATFAPGASDLLMDLVIQKRLKRSKTSWRREQSEKFTDLIENVVEEYQVATSRQTRMQILGIVAPVLRFSEMQQYIPGITPYTFHQARLHAKMTKSGMTEQAAGTRKERYDKKKVRSFILYITSPHVITNLPFGYLTTRTSAGVKIELPSLIRVSVNKRIVQAYSKFLQDTGQTALAMSQSTMIRILQACKAKTRKSWLGMDYMTYAGLEGLDYLLEFVKKFKAQNSDWVQEASRVLRETKHFYKTDYKIYIQTHSEYSDYCRTYALSDPDQPEFQAPEQHGMKKRCGQCLALIYTLNEIKANIDDFQWETPKAKEEAKFLFDNAQSNIVDWQKHIVRTVNQDLARTDMLADMDGNTVFITIDFAMKFIPMRGRESQTEWYGKSGILWHVAVCWVKDPDTKVISQRVFAHIYPQDTKQNADTILATMLDILQRIKAEKPHITRSIWRSDNAGYYHGQPTIAAIPELSKKTGITIVRWDFSEAQSGKGPCDRSSTVIKRNVRLHVSENHQCVSPTEFLRCANSNQGVRSTTFVHASVDTEPGKRGLGTIPEISKYNNFHFDDNQIRAWRAYGIGLGRVLRFTARTKRLPRLNVQLTGTHGSEQQGLHNTAEYWVAFQKQFRVSDRRLHGTAEQEPDTSGWARDELDDYVPDGIRYEDSAHDQAPTDPSGTCPAPDKTQLLFPCDQDGCTKIYQSFQRWWKHTSIGKHKFRVERQTLRDYSIRQYLQEIEASQVYSTTPEIRQAIRSQQDEESAGDASTAHSKGWALREGRKHVTFSQPQKDYLLQLFNHGATSGDKYTPQEAEKKMREHFPNKSDWLTWTQIASWFSREAKKREREGAGGGGGRATRAAGTAEEHDYEYDLELLPDDDPADEIVEDMIQDAIDDIYNQIFERDQK